MGSTACVGGTCVARSSKCSADGLSSVSVDETSTSCGLYRCGSNGLCNKTCSSTSDCAPGNLCDSTSNACVATPPAAEEGGGCAIESPGDKRGAHGAMLLAALAALLVRSRRV